MASKAAQDVKFGFWVAAGFAVFGIAAAIILGLSMAAIGRSG
jgi:hypothetical protein